MDSFIGTIMAWAPNFAPRGWALCDGQLLPISSNTALFSLIGTIYGGDGRTTFALPDLRGRTPIGAGRGPGLSNVTQGNVNGSETVTLTTQNLPSITTTLNATATAAVPAEAVAGNTDVPTDARLAEANFQGDAIGSYSTSAATGTMGAIPISVQTQSQTVGSGLSFGNMQNYQTVNYIICLTGVFPSRS